MGHTKFNLENPPKKPPKNIKGSWERCVKCATACTLPVSVQTMTSLGADEDQSIALMITMYNCQMCEAKNVNSEWVTHSVHAPNYSYILIF